MAEIWIDGLKDFGVHTLQKLRNEMVIEWPQAVIPWSFRDFEAVLRKYGVNFRHTACTVQVS